MRVFQFNKFSEWRFLMDIFLKVFYTVLINLEMSSVCQENFESIYRCYFYLYIVSVPISYKIVKNNILLLKFRPVSLTYVRCYAWGIKKKLGVMKYYDR